MWRVAGLQGGFTLQPCYPLTQRSHCNPATVRPVGVSSKQAKRHVLTHDTGAGGLRLHMASTWNDTLTDDLCFASDVAALMLTASSTSSKPTLHPQPHPLVPTEQIQALHIFRRLHRSAHRRASTTASVRSSSSSRRAPTASTTTSSSPSTPSRSCRLALHHRHPPASSRRCSTTSR